MKSIVATFTSSEVEAPTLQVRGPLEKSTLRIGIIPLTDCAVIVAAKERGYFARHGLDVEITREATWAGIRDKLAAGVLDAAHMLAGIPVATVLGIEALDCPMVTAMSLGLNGNAVTVSRSLYEEMAAAAPQAASNRQASAQVLSQVIARRKREHQPPLTLAVVHPFSSHNYLLRYWLAAAGIDPSRDVHLTVVPPPRMVDHLRDGRIDGFCVGEPWNALAAVQGVGQTIVAGYDIWQNAPEKVLGVTRTWAQRHPRTHRAVLRAVIEAAQWSDQPPHRGELASMLCRGGYVNVPEEVLTLSLGGQLRVSADAAVVAVPDYHNFFRHAATFPWRSHAAWFITQMIRWGDLDRLVNITATAREVYLSDVYRAACSDLGIACPVVDQKDEGMHERPWTLRGGGHVIAMGADHFCDGASFNPNAAISYLARFQIAAIAPAWRDHAKAVSART